MQCLTLGKDRPSQICQWETSAHKIVNIPGYKKTELSKLSLHICALLNTNGGTILLDFSEVPISEEVDKLIRMIEQQVLDLMGEIEMTRSFKIKRLLDSIEICVKSTGRFFTIKYNLFLPTNGQVIQVRPSNAAHYVYDIIQQIPENNEICKPNKYTGQTFVKGCIVGFQESEVIQFKQLKAESSKCITLADRIVNKGNKLASYVSAFANHHGGHIFYGIKDDGIVEGETISDKEKEESVRKVSRTINKMIWPQKCGKPERGLHWDIAFEPVDDVNGSPIPSTFVIVIYVTSYPGGVFTEEPESYHIVQGEAKRMNFQEWWPRFAGVFTKDRGLLAVPTEVSRVHWSSEKNKRFFRVLTTKLIQHRNNEEMDAFWKLCELAKKQFTDCNAKHVVLAETAMVANKHFHFNKAESLRKQFAAILPSSKDSVILEVRMLLLQSIIERSKGDYGTCYQINQQGLQLLQLIPVEIYTVWFCIEAAMVTTIVLTTVQDVKTYRFLKDAAKRYLEMAGNYANSLEDLPFRVSDLQQKLHIYRARILLECTDTGHPGQQHHTLSLKDIEAAAEELGAVSQIVLNGNPLTHFRRVEYYLVQCDLFCRHAEVFQKTSLANLKQAFEYATLARDLARKHCFEIMVDFADNRLANLTEKLVRHAISSGGTQENRDFFGFEY